MKKDKSNIAAAVGIILTVACMVATVPLASRYESAAWSDTAAVTENPAEESVPTRADTIRMMAEAFAIQESRLNPSAVSSCGNYVGCLQISAPLVRGINRILEDERYTFGQDGTEDHRLSKEHSYDMFTILMEKRNPTLDMDKAVDLWNRRAPDSYRNNVKKNFRRLLEETTEES